MPLDLLVCIRQMGERLATKTLSNGVVTRYTYDAVEWMNSITVSLGSTVLWAECYGYTTGAWEGSGETARQRSLKGETSGSERVNCYVAGERIYTLHGATGTVGDAYWLDAASQLRGVKYSAADATGAYSGVNATTTTEWSYDAVGNRLEETSGAGTTNYTVNTINQYTAVTGMGVLAYSVRGDLTQLGDWELTYDAQGNLLRAHNTVTNALAQYWRDATGHRAVKDVDGNKTLFFNLGTTPLETYDLTGNTTSSTIYEPGIDRPLAEASDSGDVTFYHQDWLGSVVLLTAALGAKIQSYTYDAWGQPNGFDTAGVGIPPANFVSRFLYTGREYDIETALYHYRARAYSPTLGRFLQPDPIDFGGGDGNLFRYVANNSINFIDPLGLDVFFNRENRIGGHAWVKIGGETPSGGEKTYGQYPDGSLFGKPAFIESPDRHSNDSNFTFECYSTTPEDEADLDKWIKDNFDINTSGSSKNPNYDFGINDCRTFNKIVKQQLKQIINNRGGKIQSKTGKVPKR